MSVRLSICPHGKLGSHRTDFLKFHICEVFENLAEKIQVSLKYNKNNGRALYMKTDTYFFIISRSILRIRNVSDKRFRQMFQKNVSDKCFRKNVSDKCFRKIFQTNVTEKCFRQMFQTNVSKKNISDKCFRQMLQRISKHTFYIQ